MYMVFANLRAVETTVESKDPCMLAECRRSLLLLCDNLYEERCELFLRAVVRGSPSVLRKNTMLMSRRSVRIVLYYSSIFTKGTVVDGPWSS